LNAPAVLPRREGGVLHLTLNRPESRNALSMAMVAELRAALAGAAAADVRVIVLRGVGGHFCSGGDLKDMAAGAGDPAALLNMNAAFGHLCCEFADTGIATVAVLEGTVMGGGFGLACVADVALASETVSFRLPETSLGVVPAQIAPFLVQRLGYSQARRLAVSGGRLDGLQALALGLVHELHADVDAALARVLGEIQHCAPQAVAATKSLMAKARLHDAAGLVDEAAAVFARATLSEEGLEGISAFVEKRKPKWASA